MSSPPETASGVTGVAVDLGGTKLAVARIASGRVVERQTVSTQADAGADRLFDTVLELIAALAPSPEEAIGVALAGRIDQEGAWHAVNQTTLEGVQGFPMRARLERSLGRPVRVRNDGQAAAIGEYRMVAEQGVRSLAYITVSTGIGGGIILDSRPLGSPDGLAGHIGFTTIRDGRSPCGSGRVGTVESVASGRAISAAAAAGGRHDTDAKAVFAAHLAGEDWASSLVGRSAEAVAELCANLKALFDVELIVLGGSVGLAEGYLGLVADALEREPTLFQTPLKRAALGADSALFGVLFDLRDAKSPQ